MPEAQLAAAMGPVQTGVADGDFLQRLHAVGGEARRDDVDIAPLHERYSNGSFLFL